MRYQHEFELSFSSVSRSMDLLIAAQNASFSVWLRSAPLVEPVLLAVNIAACAGLVLLLASRRSAWKRAFVLIGAHGAAAAMSGGLLLLVQPFKYCDWRLTAPEMLLVAAGGWRSVQAQLNPVRK